MGLLGVARANSVVGVSLETTFLLLLLHKAPPKEHPNTNGPIVVSVELKRLMMRLKNHSHTSDKPQHARNSCFVLLRGHRVYMNMFGEESVTTNWGGREMTAKTFK
jgi:hypothetical protein